MGAPIGNTNSNKNNRMWADTIRRVHVQTEGERLRKIAEKLYEMAEAGDIQAIKEIGDRMDGKPAQSLDLGSDPDKPLQVVSRIELVDLGSGTGSATGEA